MELNIGEYVRTEDGYIAKIEDIDSDNYLFFDNQIYKNFNDTYDSCYLDNIEISKSSSNITDLIEYMDLLILEHSIKLYDKNITIGLFNPVRCDGFTTYEDGTHCIILNMDYIVDIKDLKIKKIITHEELESVGYKVNGKN